MQSAPWLERICSPADLKGLSVEALGELAEEIRRIIAKTCSQNGGHFAPSLGVVELTLALHRVFDTPRDKIVWDVGHQAYPHKLLTGRYAEFHTLRMLGGLSGFPKRAESPYDAFGVGHASTSISAALGMALARDLLGEDYRVVSVTGDGAMTGGLCYEALNNVGYAAPDMLLILNDNEMSIAPNIGAMSQYFNDLITTNFYNRSKQTAKGVIKRALGERAVSIGHRIEASIKGLILPEETIFEKMGIRYLGPVDGHDLPRLIAALTHVRDLKGPILLHVKTIKGKGYTYSESDPERWHSGANFEISTGEKVLPVNAPAQPTPAPLTFTQVFSQALARLGAEDSRVVAITAAMSAGTGLDDFAQRFPNRFHDVGIAEGHAVTCAAGMACEGLRPVVAIYSTFLQRSFDNIIHDVALQKLPVTFAVDRAGIVGGDGPTHHGVFDLSYLRMIPDLVVMAPRDAQQMRAMVRTAAAYEEGPVAYRYPRGAAAEQVGPPTADAVIPLGTGEILREALPASRHDVAILSIGAMASRALEAAELLSREGLGVAVADMRFVKPLDLDLLKRLALEYDHLVTVEENVVAGGFGAAVTEAFCGLGIEGSAPLLIGLPDEWIEHGAVEELRERCGLSGPGIVERIRHRWYPEGIGNIPLAAIPRRNAVPVATSL
ncbi:MAG TPA: 1-deoxy-D-xylulose-5-phosphate synthase [Candidatus Sumerlaeota bacterium]|nr:1-deoxy-D-xylulose-5-phosphate synthase [Candidatus Sumerlaeota bacterium]HPS00358.1 1-deoxy-D-xylulose-5-phosphate synthase [Candidatus Sumerlaeota bacterium]